MNIDYEKIKNLGKKLSRIMEDFISLENQLSLEKFYKKKLNYSLNLIKLNMINISNIFRDLIKESERKQNVGK